MRGPWVENQGGEQVAGSNIYEGNKRRKNAREYEQMIKCDNGDERPPGAGVPSYADCPE